MKLNHIPYINLKLSSSHCIWSTYMMANIGLKSRTYWVTLVSYSSSTHYMCCRAIFGPTDLLIQHIQSLFLLVRRQHTATPSLETWQAYLLLEIVLVISIYQLFFQATNQYLNISKSQIKLFLFHIRPILSGSTTRFKLQTTHHKSFPVLSSSNQKSINQTNPLFPLVWKE